MFHNSTQSPPSKLTIFLTPHILLIPLLLFLLNAPVFSSCFPLLFAAEKQNMQRVKRIIIMPWKICTGAKDKIISRILPDRMSLFFNMTPGFISVEYPLDLEMDKMEFLEQETPSKLASRFKQVHAHYVVMGQIRKQQVCLFLLDVEKEVLSKIDVITSNTMDFEVIEKLIGWLGTKLGEAPNDVRFRWTNLDGIRYKSLEAMKEYLIALSFLEEGKGPKDVMPRIENAIKLDPNLLSARSLYADCLAKLGDYANAEDIYDAILIKSPDFLPAMLGKGILYAAQNDYRTALKITSLSLKRLPNNILLMYNKAYFYEQIGELDKARENYQKILESDPYNELARYNLATLYFNLRKYSQAQVLFESLEKDFPQKVMYSYSVASCYMRIGDSEMARKKLIAISSIGDYKEVFNDLGIIARGEGKLKEAEEYFWKALKIDPEYSPAYNNLGVLFLLQDKTDLARENFHKALQFNIRNADALYNLGLLYLRENNFDRAWLYFSRSAEISPLFVEAQINRAITEMYRGNLENALKLMEAQEKKFPDNPLILYNLGVLYRAAGKTDRAVDCFRKTSNLQEKLLRELKPTENSSNRRILEAKKILTDSLNNIGVILIGQKRFDEAAASLDKALVISPNDSVLLFNRGLVEYYINDYEKAQVFFQNSLEREPGFKQARLFLTRSYLNSGNYCKAKIQIDTMLAKEPNSHQWLYLLAVYYERTGQLEHAARILKDMVEKNDSNLEEYSALGMLYIAMRRFEEAEKIFDRLVQIDSANIDYLSNLALSKAMLGRYDGAIATMNLALKISPEQPILFYRLAFIYCRMNNREKTLETLRKAIEKDPEIKKVVEKDEDFKQFWDDPEYRKLVDEEKY